MHKVLISCMGGYGAEHLANSIVNSSIGPQVEIHGTHADRFLLARSSARHNFLSPWSSSADKYIQSISNYIVSERIDLFVPKSDKEVAVCSEYRNLIPCMMFLPESSDILAAQDKLTFHNILDKAGVHVAKTEQVNSTEQLSDIFTKLGPAEKYWVRVKSAGEAGAFGATWVKKPAQARYWIQLWNELYNIPVSEFTISEYLPGRLFEVLILFSQGELKIAKVYENIEYHSGSGFSGVGSTPRVAKSCSDSQAVLAVNESLKAIDALAKENQTTPNGVYHFSVKENSNSNPCITECNIGRFPSTSGFLNQIGQVNMGEWFARFALNELSANPPSNLIDLEHSSIYLVRSLDHTMSLFSESAINLHSLN